MERRSFLGAMALIGAAFGLPWPNRSHTAEATMAASTKAARRIHLQTSPLAGFQYYAGEEVWDQLRVGDSLSLRREPGNAHDAKAIIVEWEGTKLGYLPRNENITIAGLMDAGEDVTAGVGYLREDQRPWGRVGVEVLLWI